MKHWKRIVLGAVASAAVVASIFLGKWYGDNRKPNFKRDVDLFVYPDMSPAAVLALVPDDAVASRRSLFRVFGKYMTEESVKPGHYVIEKGKPSVYVPRMLKKGWQTPVNLVLSGTMRQKGSIARKIGNQMMMDSAFVAESLGDSLLLAKYGFTPKDMFSLIMPDTYQVYWTDSMDVILGKQKAAWDAFWTAENVEKAKTQGLTPKQVSIVASIVKAESNHGPEYPRIAGVYLNRLHQGMKLQADPTVAFCFDYSLTRILLKHLQVDSPYNTYAHEGLPPGPICVPDKASLEAVLNPDKHGYLFFCASPDMDGTHRFASTLSEHNRNAREFQRALDARRAK